MVGPGHLSLVTGVRGHEDHAGVPLDDPEPGDVTGSEFLHILPEISRLRNISLTKNRGNSPRTILVRSAR